MNKAIITIKEPRDDGMYFPRFSIGASMLNGITDSNGDTFLFERQAIVSAIESTIIHDGKREIKYHVETDGKISTASNNDNPPISGKPPLGVTPRKIWLENRRENLRDACKRYIQIDSMTDSQFAHLSEWVVEINIINNELNK